jgi:hypothetical protein
MLQFQQWDGTSYEEDLINDSAAFDEMGIWAVHFPVTSAAHAADSETARTAAPINRIFDYQFK